MTLDFMFTIMHYIALHHFNHMILSSCHALDFGVLHIIINFFAAGWPISIKRTVIIVGTELFQCIWTSGCMHVHIYDDSRQECMMTCTVDIHYSYVVVCGSIYD